MFVCHDCQCSSPLPLVILVMAVLSVRLESMCVLCVLRVLLVMNVGSDHRAPFVVVVIMFRCSALRPSGSYCQY